MLSIAGMAFIIALTGAIAPGPVLALVVAQVLAQGPVAAALIVAGHAAAELVAIAALALGVRKVLENPRLRGTVSIIGGMALALMGLDLLRQAAAVAVKQTTGAPLPWFALVAGGAIASVSNPYFTGWWATVGAGQIAALRLTRPRDWIAFYLGHEMGDLAWYMAVAVALTAGRNLLAGQIFSTILYICGGLILALAVWFIAAGLRIAIKQATGNSAPKPDAD